MCLGAGTQFKYTQLCRRSIAFGPGGTLSKVIQNIGPDTGHGITTHSHIGGAAPRQSSGSPVAEWLNEFGADILLHTQRRNLEPADHVN